MTYRHELAIMSIDWWKLKKSHYIHDKIYPKFNRVDLYQLSVSPK